MTILQSKSIYYKDCNLIAQPTRLLSRTAIAKELERIVVSPMASIVGETFARKALELGLTVVLHRFDSIDNRVSLFKKLYSRNNKESLWVSVGLKEDATPLVEAGATSILIDVANGYMQSVVGYAQDLAFRHPIERLMVGNIHSSSMLLHYLNLANKTGLDIYYRCGIASGSACNTKGMTGYNRGQITEIAECYEFSSHYKNLILVADGGIANPSYAVKAFGAGAEMVMMGGYFSRARESHHVVEDMYKFWGGASEYQQVLSNGEATRHSEGKELEVDKGSIVSLEALVNDLWGGIASGVSYSGHTSLASFIGNGVFELIT